MFYHGHAFGIARLNVYAGEAAGYLLVDPVEENGLAAATVPGTIATTPDLAHPVPLVIQDKTFVPDNGETGGQLAATDPTWDVAKFGGKGSLWFPTSTCRTKTRTTLPVRTRSVGGTGARGSGPLRIRAPLSPRACRRCARAWRIPPRT